LTDRLRPFWDFDDLDASEQRFRTQLEHETTDPGRAEVLTQLARVEGLRSDFDKCLELLDEAEPLAGQDPAANIRLELERGRMFRSSGDPEAAYPLFQDAFARAVEAGQHFLAGDAAHMCAISVDDRKLMEDWTTRGLELGERERDAEYWAGPLLNNLAWAYHKDGDHARALELFQRALEARERDPGNEGAIAFARYGVGVALRTLGRPREAIAMLEPAVAWAQDARRPDPEYEQELAEAQAALGRPAASACRRPSA
jgi:tetratricopeptide (TPR) repeat protein